MPSFSVFIFSFCQYYLPLVDCPFFCFSGRFLFSKTSYEGKSLVRLVVGINLVVEGGGFVNSTASTIEYYDTYLALFQYNRIKISKLNVLAYILYSLDESSTLVDQYPKKYRPFVSVLNALTNYLDHSLNPS